MYCALEIRGCNLTSPVNVQCDWLVIACSTASSIAEKRNKINILFQSNWSLRALAMMIMNVSILYCMKCKVSLDPRKEECQQPVRGTYYWVVVHTSSH